MSTSGQRDDGERDVADEDDDVGDPDGVVRAGEAHVAVQPVVGDVADEEERGEGEGREHGGAVRRDPLAPDEQEAADERDGAEAVEERVERGQEAEAHVVGVRRVVGVDQPEEKCGGERGDGEDGADGDAGGEGGGFVRGLCGGRHRRSDSGLVGAAVDDGPRGAKVTRQKADGDCEVDERANGRYAAAGSRPLRSASTP